MTLCDEMAKATATLTLALGGMGLRSAERGGCPLGELGGHPAVAELIVGSLIGV